MYQKIGVFQAAVDSSYRYYRNRVSESQMGLLRKSLSMELEKFDACAIIKELEGTGVRAELERACVPEIKDDSSKIRKWKRLNSFPLEFVTKLYPHFICRITHLKSGTGLGFSRIKIPKEFDKNLAYMLGALRDGSLINSNGKHWVRIYDKKYSDWLEKIAPIFENLLEIKFHIRYQKKFNEKYLDISSKPLLHFLKILVGKELHKDVPKLIKNAELTIQKSYISGFFDAEGHVPSNIKKARRITFSQKDKSSLMFIKATLEKINIKCGKISNHTLPIFGKENMNKFYEQFEILYPEKINKFKTFVEYPGLNKLPRG